MKNILITGSSSGMGKAIAQRLLAMGHCVIGLARDHQKFDPQHKHYHSYSIDFSCADQLEDQLKQLSKQHPRIDVIVCSAGYGQFQNLEQFSFQQMCELMQVNFLSQALLIKIFLPQMKQRQSGQIILMGSECSLEGYKQATLYCASKFALRGFSQSLRKECASAHVGVSLINPGLVDTPFFDELNFRPGEHSANAIQPEQIAQTVELLVNMDHNCLFEEINLQPIKKVISKRS